MSGDDIVAAGLRGLADLLESGGDVHPSNTKSTTDLLRRAADRLDHLQGEPVAWANPKEWRRAMRRPEGCYVWISTGEPDPDDVPICHPTDTEEETP